MSATFYINLSWSYLSAPTENEDGRQHTKLNLRKEMQAKIMVCKRERALNWNNKEFEFVRQMLKKIK